MPKILGSGAEATVYLNNGDVIKQRSRKSYRHELIDLHLRNTRTRKEAKILKALEKHGFAPRLIGQKDNDLMMEYIDGIQLKVLLDKNPKLASLVGKNLTIMHDDGMIHGDLTTSNMILADVKSTDRKSDDKKPKGNELKDNKAKDKRLYFIDFGLSFNSHKIEDKAVDIHLFKQALESKHYKIADSAYREFIKAYNPKDKKEILGRLAIVEQRGRYKEKI